MTTITAIFGAIFAFFAGIGPAFTAPHVMQILPPQAAMVQAISLDQTPKVIPAAAVAPNLLPSVKIGIVKKVIQHAPSPTPAISPAPINRVAAATGPVTVQSLFAATNVALSERLDGQYEARFSANVGSGNPLSWNLSQSTIGGGSLPQFSFSYDCTPAPLPANTQDANQNPTFTPRTSYSCSISLTPLSGSDMRTQSKQFSFDVPPGQINVTPPQSMNTVLKNNQNNGGFVFANHDTQPVTIKSLTFDVSYTALTTVYGPLVFRLINPETGQSAGDYDLENIPAVSGREYSFAKTGIVAPINFTVPAGGQKMIPVELLGVDAMSISGVDPSITIALRGVSADPASSTLALNSATLTWSCIVTFQAYDPNATSGALVSGQACNVGGN